MADMKTTQAQQDRTRAQIVEAAVQLMTQHGYEAVTMKDIARAAGIGDATVYKYFATKERLLLGYFDLVAAQALAATRATPGIDDYDLQSRLQRLTDAVLERLQPDRPFVALARDMLARSPLLMLGDQLKAKQLLKDAVGADLAHAVDRAEIPPSDFLGLMSGLYVDYCFGVIAYWLGDESDGAADTTRLVDQTLGILVAMLRSGLPDRIVQLGLFVVRSQLARLAPVARAARAQREAPNATPSRPARKRAAAP
jgi:TetR/AcrR family transcriptional regulator, regulator of autoinduction and epiphytic fitness